LELSLSSYLCNKVDVSIEYLIDGCVNVLRAVCVTGWSTCGRPDLFVQSTGTRRAAHPGTILIRREYARRGRYSACCGLSTSSIQSVVSPSAALLIIILITRPHLYHVWWKAIPAPIKRHRCPLDRSGPMRLYWGPIWDQVAGAMSDHFVVASLTLNLGANYDLKKSICQNSRFCITVIF